MLFIDNNITIRLTAPQKIAAIIVGTNPTNSDFIAIRLTIAMPKHIVIGITISINSTFKFHFPKYFL